MPNRAGQMWIGHFIISPAHRGRLVGTRFAQSLLACAFSTHSAADVLLVVFPENTTAIRCYQRVGMIELGHERKFFRSTGREHAFRRMGINISRFRNLVAAGQLPEKPPPFRTSVS